MLMKCSVVSVEWGVNDRFPPASSLISLGQAGCIESETEALLQIHDVDHARIFSQDVIACLSEWADEDTKNWQVGRARGGEGRGETESERGKGGKWRGGGRWRGWESGILAGERRERRGESEMGLPLCCS
jgi:hypothetical protein